MKIPVTALLSATATVTGPSSTTTLFETKTVPLAYYNPGTTTMTPVVSGAHHIVGPGGRPCGDSGVCARDEQGPVIDNIDALSDVASLVARGGDLDGTAAATGGIQMQDAQWTTLTGRAPPPLAATEAPMPPFTTGYFDEGPHKGHGPVVNPSGQLVGGVGHGPVVHLPPDVERSRISELLKTATPAPLPTATEAPHHPVITDYLDKRDTKKNGPVVIDPNDMEKLSKVLKTKTLSPQSIATEAPNPPIEVGYLDKRDTKGPFPEIDWLGFAVEGDADGPVSATPVERAAVQEHESKEGIWGYDEFGYRLPDACRKPHIGNCR